MSLAHELEENKNKKNKTKTSLNTFLDIIDD